MDPSPGLEQCIHTIPKDRLKKLIGALDSETLMIVSKKVILALGLETALIEG